MLDYLDGLIAAERRMFPTSEPARHQALKIAGLATGLGDKAVSLFYERLLHETLSDLWVERCRKQIRGAMAALEADRSTRPETYWFGDRIGHADIAVAAVLRFIGEAHPGLVSLTGFPALEAHAARMEALPVFGTVSQPFIPPA